ncbi:MAG: zinc-binding dehydrogenase [bacterium TMED217]|nr:MAG: zinc-binding dehydrogenase [bacterium TMED217]|tara:strand:- start:15877 stop:16860 length:984 start_codon:yes stop_codon:yes gene_type:complete
MKAAWYNSFGPAEEVLKIGEFDTPEPRPGEVKIRIYASGVNPSDTKKRLGANPALLDDGPVIPNSDGAGEIISVGEGISSSRIGERVWVYNAQYGRQLGTSAEYVCLPSVHAIILPDTADYSAGAMMGIPAMTAHRCVFSDGAVDSQTLLITGGAGRVGYYAIQWAKQNGSTVIATASSDASREQCVNAGADLIVGHPSDDSVGEIMDFTNGKKIDRIIEGDFGANLLPVLDVLKTSGTIATYSSMTDMNPSIPFIRMMFMDITIRMVLVYAMPDEAKKHAAKDITSALSKNTFHNRVAQEYSIDNISDAHKMIESGEVYGSVIIKP